MMSDVFFFQAEDGIRDRLVTGVQTCALPICWGNYFKLKSSSQFYASDIFFALSPTSSNVPTYENAFSG